MLQDLARSPDTVDVSMETLASLWAHDPSDPCDLIDLGEKRHEPSSVWEAQCVFNSSPAAGLMWTEQLSPHLQRNKQLQDTLLQREEELARLQEENNKLREFLNSSFVRNLEEKAKKLTADGRRKLKRNLMSVDDGPLHNGVHHLASSQQVSKRVCRNLTAEFCSDFSETSVAASEPNLDLWVLRTLGLKDRDTIDTSDDSSSPSSGFSLGGLVYDAAVASSTSDSSPVAASPPPSVCSYRQSSTRHTEFSYSDKRSCADPAVKNCTSSPDRRSDLTATSLNGQYDAPAAVIGSFSSLTAFHSPLAAETPFRPSPERPEICSMAASAQSRRLEVNPADQSAYWSPLELRGSSTPSQDTIQFSPSGERVRYSPVSSSSPVMNQPWTPVRPASPPPAASTPQMPRSRTELAFSMSLSPSSSVKTHSFPQGQAFVRKDNEGRWNFTWMPRQGP